MALLRSVFKRIGAFFFSLLPKRKTVTRAIICALLASMPFLLLAAIRRPLAMLVLVAACVALGWAFGMQTDFAKQIRWMRRMSAQGPIVWGYRRAKRLVIYVARKLYGNKLDVEPLQPVRVFASTIMCTAAVLKWKPQMTSSFSEETYELQLAIIPEEVADGEELAPDWMLYGDTLTSAQLSVGELTSDTNYIVRVRAGNAKGRSGWAVNHFRTKQVPVDGGGCGPNYKWTQASSGKGELTLKVPLPPGTRARQISVKVKRAHIEILLDGHALIVGALFGSVQADETEWEVSEQKELQVTLFKDKEGSLPIDFWPCVVLGHPEIEVSGLKKDAAAGGGLGSDPEQMQQMMSQLAQMQGGD
mmetsp:Transcript_23846/g.39426  ORF Transcript_23846/g.39426 Transcript_23846/m.39426 type:complete len:360 (+) Transcript_23846:51-1130(+)|eukprot:CAMPEP_0119342778 /NCGR_PEP_ID=MMETSP1333-20130426/105417_1 /TAXON_ID=418940 /ORGANISM="Scyphosphaera apsteinii, Strain RCC1455" /LENGTH=359 /DNA_ID=CAMNT_0007355065 /DNA_START=44 /DNA_END=1123 /DNA_ORIENTATION=+